MATEQNDTPVERFSSRGDIKPLNQRVAAIRNEFYSINLYTKKYITVDLETSSAKKYLQNDVLEPVILLIRRAVFYTYKGLRSVESFVAFFHSLYHDVITPVGQSQIKQWFLQSMKLQEFRHYTDQEERSSLEKQKQEKCLTSMVQGILNDKLADDIDCVVFFTSITLKTLGLISCKTIFDRRVRRLQSSSLFESEPYETAKVTRHFILATMDTSVDTSRCDHDYATIPLERLSEFEHLFRSYSDHNPNVMNIMLDLFMDEIEHNHTFWIHLIKRCSDILPSESIDDGQPPSLQTTFGHLLGLKFKRFYDYSSPVKEHLLQVLSYASALLIKENLVSMRVLVQYIDVRTDGYGQQFLTALFSVGNFDTVLWILRNSDNFPEMDEDFYSRIHDALDTAMGTTLKKADATFAPPPPAPTTKMTAQQLLHHVNDRPAPDTTQRAVFCFDFASDSEEEEESHESNSTNVSTFSSINSRKDCDEPDSAFHTATDLSDLFSKRLFDDNWKVLFDDCSNTAKVQLLSKFIMPCFNILGFTRMINASSTVNKFIILLESALISAKEKDDRTPLLQMISRFVLPALTWNPSIEAHDCIMRGLTEAERYQSYNSWREDGLSNLEVQRRLNKAKQDFKVLLDNDASKDFHIGKTALALLRSHPIDMADLVIYEMQFNYNMTLSKRRFIGDLYTHTSCKLALDILAAQMANKIISSRSMIFDQKENKPRMHKLPESIELLCAFARHLFKDRHVSSVPLYQYLSLYLHQKTQPPPSATFEQQKYPLPWFFSTSFLQFVCARTNEYTHHVNNNKRKVNTISTLSPTCSKKRTFRALGDSYSNKK